MSAIFEEVNVMDISEEVNVNAMDIFEEVNAIDVVNVTQEVYGLDVSDDFISDNIDILTPNDLFVTCVTGDEDFSCYYNDIGDVPFAQQFICHTPPIKAPITEPPPLIGKKRVFEEPNVVQIKTRCIDWDY